jgi:hypothetical protein
MDCTAFVSSFRISTSNGQLNEGGSTSMGAPLQVLLFYHILDMRTFERFQQLPDFPQCHSLIVQVKWEVESLAELRLYRLGSVVVLGQHCGLSETFVHERLSLLLEEVCLQQLPPHADCLPIFENFRLTEYAVGKVLVIDPWNRC